jgi:hypothetical protein
MPNILREPPSKRVYVAHYNLCQRGHWAPDQNFNLRRSIIQNAVSGGWSRVFCSTTDPNLWSTECIGLYNHITNVIAVGALERAEVETYACWHDVSEHHVSMAFWTSWTMDLSAYVVRQEIRFLHDASLNGGGSTTLSVTDGGL